MYAVIETGGKQHRVAVGDRLCIEAIVAEPGTTVELTKVLMISDGGKLSVGTPHITKATVKAKVLGHGRHDKIRVFKMRRRKNYRRTQGHRQKYTEVQVENIDGVGSARTPRVATESRATAPRPATASEQRTAPGKRATDKTDKRTAPKRVAAGG